MKSEKGKSNSKKKNGEGEGAAIDLPAKQGLVIMYYLTGFFFTISSYRSQANFYNDILDLYNLFWIRITYPFLDLSHISI